MPVIPYSLKASGRFTSQQGLGGVTNFGQDKPWGYMGGYITAELDNPYIPGGYAATITHQVLNDNWGNGYAGVDGVALGKGFVVLTQDPVVTIQYPGAAGPGTGGTTSFTAVEAGSAAENAPATYDYGGINVYLKTKPPTGSLVNITYMDKPSANVPQTGQQVAEAMLTNVTPSNRLTVGLQLQNDVMAGFTAKTACINSVPRLFNDPTLIEVLDEEEKDVEAEKQAMWESWGMWLGFAALLMAFAPQGGGSGEGKRR